MTRAAQIPNLVNGRLRIENQQIEMKTSKFRFPGVLKMLMLSEFSVQSFYIVYWDTSVPKISIFTAVSDLNLKSKKDNFLSR
jgi:hypothetical protein